MFPGSTSNWPNDLGQVVETYKSVLGRRQDARELGPKSTWPVGSPEASGSCDPAGFSFSLKAVGSRRLPPSTLSLNPNQWATRFRSDAAHKGEKESPWT